MLETVIPCIELFKVIIYYAFYWSSNIGKFLVEIVIESLGLLVTSIRILTNLFFVLTESLGIFCRDVVQLLLSLLGLLMQFYKQTENRVIWTQHKINSTVDQISLSISSFWILLNNGFGSIFSTIGEIFLFCKHVVVLFGSCVWFVVTFIPFSIWNFVFGINNFLEELHKTTFDLTRNSAVYFKNCFIFLTDIPAEAAIGLLFAASLVYIFSQFYIVIFSYLYRHTRSIALSIYRKFRRRSRRVQRQVIQQRNSQVVPRKRPEIRSELNLSHRSKEDGAEEVFCIICQERLKCILVLPCRHVCMCSECNSRLQLYNNTCPICRNNIESTMKIFF
ncbi:uncharacterized protein [Leptinotarsa decemlineata]|uniref:uncharacterized protein n=1 Tax=Leptinotarsa decemlineata TaxID=7539 RepID=UPI003D30D5FC